MTDGYLDELRAAFSAARAATTCARSATLGVAGAVLRLEFASDELAEATIPALGHLHVSSEAEPTMSVELFDSESSGVTLPPAPWTADDVGPMGVVRGHEDGPRRIAIDPTTRTLTVADRERRQAVVWTASGRLLPVWWRACPMRFLLDIALAGPRRHMVHAAAVAVDGRGVLLGGRAGAGKSTLAVACAYGGMDFVGDDYVLVEAGPPAQAFGLFGTAKLDAGSLAAIPAAQQAVIHAGEPGVKSVLDLDRAPDVRLAAAARIDAVVLPTRTGEPGRLRPISGLAAVRSLAPSTIFQAPGGGAPALEIIADVVRGVPAYELTTGPDVASAPKLLAELLA